MARLIDADELIYGLKTEFGQFAMKYILAFIKAQPTVDPVKHGRWIFIEQLSGGYYSYKCSECQRLENVEKRQMLGNYCSYCGAKMLGMEE